MVDYKRMEKKKTRNKRVILGLIQKEFLVEDHGREEAVEDGNGPNGSGSGSG